MTTNNCTIDPTNDRKNIQEKISQRDDKSKHANTWKYFLLVEVSTCSVSKFMGPLLL